MDTVLGLGYLCPSICLEFGGKRITAGTPAFAFSLFVPNDLSKSCYSEAVIENAIWSNGSGICSSFFSFFFFPTV